MNRKKLLFALPAIALAAMVGALPAKAGTLLCPNAANQGGFGSDTFTPTAGSQDATCGANSAIIMSITTNTDYARLEWTGTGLTLGTLGLTTANVTLVAPAGDQPYYMMTFQDPGNFLGAPAGHQILMLEFQASTVSGSSMVLDPNATLFNTYDNTAGVYLQGGQSDARTLDSWLASFPALSSDSITGFRIGEGLAGGCGGSCPVSLTIDSVNLGSTVPEPATFGLAGFALLGLGVLKKRGKR
jgi:hypothetical protein